ncbi:hypothetical protein V1523DRAFT_416591 [Lipomyces doorenjongii]
MNKKISTIVFLILFTCSSIMTRFAAIVTPRCLRFIRSQLIRSSPLLHAASVSILSIRSRPSCNVSLNAFEADGVDLLPDSTLVFLVPQLDEARFSAPLTSCRAPDRLSW